MYNMELPDDDTNVLKHVGVIIIYILLKKKKNIYIYI